MTRPSRELCSYLGRMSTGERLSRLLDESATP